MTSRLRTSFFRRLPEGFTQLRDERCWFRERGLGFGVRAGSAGHGIARGTVSGTCDEGLVEIECGIIGSELVIVVLTTIRQPLGHWFGLLRQELLPSCRVLA